MTKYNDDMVKRCVAFVEENGLMNRGGATLKQFCEAMGIADNTYYEWSKKSEFSDAIKKAIKVNEAKLTIEVENSLRKKAVGGYTLKESKTTYESDAEGNPVVVGQVVTEKEQAPDTAAAIFILCNNAPDKWQQKQTTNHTADEGLPELAIKIINSKGETLREVKDGDRQ